MLLTTPPTSHVCKVLYRWSQPINTSPTCRDVDCRACSITALARHTASTCCDSNALTGCQAVIHVRQAICTTHRPDCCCTALAAACGHLSSCYYTSHQEQQVQRNPKHQESNDQCKLLICGGECSRLRLCLGIEKRAGGSGRLSFERLSPLCVR